MENHFPRRELLERKIALKYNTKHVLKDNEFVFIKILYLSRMLFEGSINRT